MPETVGSELISFALEADPSDDNPTNDITEVFLYVGRLPYAAIDVLESQMTHSDVVVDATSSFDPDGGDINCRIDIETPDGTNLTLSGCLQNHSWSDDGIFSIMLTVTDNEVTPQKHPHPLRYSTGPLKFPYPRQQNQS